MDEHLMIERSLYLLQRDETVESDGGCQRAFLSRAYLGILYSSFDLS